MAEQVKRLPCRQRLAYGVGHVLNDLCAAMWFCYLLVFLYNIEHFSNSLAGYLVLLGQLADGFCTPFVGLGTDYTRGLCNYGKRKSWHLVGTISVAISFPFLFNQCIGCEQSADWAKFIYFGTFIVIFQFGWAASQISHLSLIPTLTANESERVELNAIRYAFTGVANILVYLIAWFLFATDADAPGYTTTITSDDAPKFRNLVFIVVSIGVVFSVLFHIGTTEGEPALQNGAKTSETIHKMSWSCWFKERQFYQVGVVYMCTRLIMNLTQIYTAMFLTETLKMNKENIATVPLVVFISGFLVSFLMKPTNRILGRKSTYLVGVLFVIASLIWMWIIQPKDALQMFGAAIFLGTGNSILLVTSLSMTADLIGSHVESGAFVYGAMSFTDKLSNGIVVAVLQQMQPCKTEMRCAASSWFYRDCMVAVPGVTAILTVLAMITLLPEELGTLRHYRGDGIRDQRSTGKDPEKQPLLHSHKGDLACTISGATCGKSKEAVWPNSSSEGTHAAQIATTTYY